MMRTSTNQRMKAFVTTLCSIALCSSVLPCAGILTAYADQSAVSEDLQASAVREDTEYRLDASEDQGAVLDSEAADEPITFGTASCVLCPNINYAGNTAPYATSNISYVSNGKTYRAQFVGWYLCGRIGQLPENPFASQPADSEDDGSTIKAHPYVSDPFGHGGYDASGQPVFLFDDLEIDHSTHHAFVSPERLSAVRSMLKLYPTRSELAVSGVNWFALCVPDFSTPVANETALPETGRTMDEAIADNAAAPVVPENSKATEPAPDKAAENAGQPVATDQTATVPESGTFSTQCRESETEAKIAELEAQGYEIVSVRKAPKWWRNW